MKCRSIIFIMLILIMAIPAISGQTVSETPPRNGTGFYHWLEIMQGDIPDTEQIEPGDMMTIHDTMIYVIPWNETKIYFYVPPGAELRSVTDVHNPLTPYNLGESEYDNWHYWEFSDPVSRQMEALSVFNGTTLSTDDYDITSIKLTDNGIGLQPNITAGTFLSSNITATDMLNAVSARIILTENLPDNVTAYISNDGGANWLNAENGTYVEFTTNGTSLRYRIELNGAGTFRPTAENISVEYNYTPVSSTTALRIEYTLTSTSTPPSFSFSKYFLYDIEATNVVLNLDEGYHADADNITWLGHEIDPTMMEAFKKPGKFLNIGTAEPGTWISLSVHEDLAEIETPNYYLYSIAAVIIIIALTGIYLMKRGGTPQSPDDAEGPDPSEKDDEAADDMEESSTSDAGLQDDLKLQKDNIMKALKKLDVDLDKGDISKEMYEELRSNYKAEAVRLMKELDKS